MPDVNGDTPIMWCAKNKKIEKFKMLLQCSGFDLNVPQGMQDMIINALFEHKNIETMNLLTESKADANTTNCVLSIACMVGHLNVVKSLVEAGAVNIKKRDKNENTPVDYAAVGGHLNVVKYLIEQGADNSFESELAKVFISCCHQNKTSVVKECIDHGVDVNFITNDGYWSGIFKF